MRRCLLMVTLSFVGVCVTACSRDTPAPTPRLTISVAADASEDVRQIVDVYNTAGAMERAAALTMLVEAHSQSVGYWIAALKDPNHLVRARAAELLGASGDATAIEPLVELLAAAGEHDWVRSAAAEALGKLGAKSAAQSLIQMLKQPVWNVRYQAAVALGLIGDPVAVEPLQELVSYEANLFVREAIQHSLEQLTD